jgi:hypothetical protein
MCFLKFKDTGNLGASEVRDRAEAFNVGTLLSGGE